MNNHDGKRAPVSDIAVRFQAAGYFSFRFSSSKSKVNSKTHSWIGYILPCHMKAITPSYPTTNGGNQILPRCPPPLQKYSIPDDHPEKPNILQVFP